MVKTADAEPHKEVSDVDIHSRVGPTVRSKKLEVEWIPNHRTESRTMTEEEHLDVRMKNQADVLAK